MQNIKEQQFPSNQENIHLFNKKTSKRPVCSWNSAEEEPLPTGWNAGDLHSLTQVATKNEHFLGSVNVITGEISPKINTGGKSAIVTRNRVNSPSAAS